MKKKSENTFLDVIRWVAILPLSLLASWIVFVVIKLLNYYSLDHVNVGSSQLIHQVFLISTSHGGMGAAFVYFGTWLAPTHKEITAFFLAGVSVAISGFFLYPSIASNNWLSVCGGIFVIIGSGIVLWQVYTKESELI